MALSDEDKKSLLDEFNKKGFILEDRVVQVLMNLYPHNKLWRNEVAKEYAQRNNGERVEFDTIIQLGMKTFLIESKRSDYDWIFASSLDKPSVMNILCLDSKEGHKSFPIKVNPQNVKVVNHTFAVKFKEDGSLDKENKKDIRTSDRIIHEAVRQTLKEAKSLFMEGDKYVKKDAHLIPIIITNARIFYLDYKKEDISNGGDLTDYSSIEEKSFVALNFSENFGFNSEKGFSSKGEENITKTVFIANITYLQQVIEELSKPLHMLQSE